MKAEERASLGAIQLRRKARDFANKTVKSQKAQFQRCVSSPYRNLRAVYGLSSEHQGLNFT